MKKRKRMREKTNCEKKRTTKNRKTNENYLDITGEAGFNFHRECGLFDGVLNLNFFYGSRDHRHTVGCAPRPFVDVNPRTRRTYKNNFQLRQFSEKEKEKKDDRRKREKKNKKRGTTEREEGEERKDDKSIPASTMIPYSFSKGGEYCTAENENHITAGQKKRENHITEE